MSVPQSSTAPLARFVANRDATSDPLMTQVAHVLLSLRHGKIEILVQNGKIILVEKHERERLFHE